MSKPTTHTYTGPAFPATASAHAGMIWGQSPEMITGSFRVASKGEGMLVLGNGESPELFWIVCVPERVELREVAA